MIFEILSLQKILSLSGSDPMKFSYILNKYVDLRCFEFPKRLHYLNVIYRKVIHHRKKLFRIIHKRAFETSIKKIKFGIFINAPLQGSE